MGVFLTDLLQLRERRLVDPDAAAGQQPVELLDAERVGGKRRQGAVFVADRARPLGGAFEARKRSRGRRRARARGRTSAAHAPRSASTAPAPAGPLRRPGAAARRGRVHAAEPPPISSQLGARERQRRPLRRRWCARGSRGSLSRSPSSRNCGRPGEPPTSTVPPPAGGALEPARQLAGRSDLRQRLEQAGDQRRLAAHGEHRDCAVGGAPGRQPAIAGEPRNLVGADRCDPDPALAAPVATQARLAAGARRERHTRRGRRSERRLDAAARGELHAALAQRAQRRDRPVVERYERTIQRRYDERAFVAQQLTKLGRSIEREGQAGAVVGPREIEVAVVQALRAAIEPPPELVADLGAGAGRVGGAARPLAVALRAGPARRARRCPPDAPGSRAPDAAAAHRTGSAARPVRAPGWLSGVRAPHHDRAGSGRRIRPRARPGQVRAGSGG